MTRLDFVNPDNIEDTKDKKTIVSVLLDESGSMTTCCQQTIDGINTYIQKLKESESKKTGQIFFSLTKFNSNKVDVVCTNKDIQSIEPLTKTTFIPDGNTPLYDAIGATITKVASGIDIKKNKPKVLMVIMTDGEENSSREFLKVKIVELIKAKEEEDWTFIYLGAGQDSWQNASSLGLSRGNVSNHSFNIPRTYCKLADSTIAYCSSDTKKTGNYFEEMGYNNKDEVKK